MRVITGKLKGRTIYTVPSSDTRPTSDKIKEAIFHVIGPYFDGGQGLDLYAGSGSLGIEVISRGIDSVTFIDRSNEALKTIRKNIRHLQLEKNSQVFRNYALRALDILAKQNRTFDIIFIDPPYESKEYTKVLKRIQQVGIINAGGYVYVEHPPNKDFIYDESFYTTFFTREYSKEIAVTILQVK